MLVLISTSKEKSSFGMWIVMVYPVVLPTHKSEKLYQGKPDQELLLIIMFYRR